MLEVHAFINGTYSLQQELSLSRGVGYFEVSADGLLLLVEDEEEGLSFFYNQNGRFLLTDRVELLPSLSVRDLVFNSSGDAIYVVNSDGEVDYIFNKTLEAYQEVEEYVDRAQLTDDLEFLAIGSSGTVHLYQNQGTGF